MLSKEQIRQIEKEVSGEEQIEATYRRLRKEGYSRQDAVRALLELLDLSLKEAKHVLLTSDTWNEARSASTSPGSPPERKDTSGGDDNSDSPIPPAPA